MAPTTARLLDFYGLVVRLFKTRPYWLVEESLVRSCFIDAFLPGDRDFDPVSACTEQAWDGAGTVDLVVRVDDDRFVVEFGGWSLATAWDPVVGTKSSNRNSAGAKLDAIHRSLDKLAAVTDPLARKLMVVYAQLPLEFRQRKRFAQGKPCTSICDGDGEIALDTPARFRLDLLFRGPPFRCACGTTFVVEVNELILGRARGSRG